VPVVTESGQSYGVYVLIDVVEGGPLHEAGFEAGDAPSGAFHSQSVAFLRRLSESCAYPDRKVSVHKVGPTGLDWETGRQLILPCVE
jgi:hypothetical protein